MEERAKEIKREGGRGQNGVRLCLGDGETEIEVTNLSKSPAERGECDGTSGKAAEG